MEPKKLRIVHVAIPNGTLPDTMIGWYSSGQYEAIREQSGSMVPVYRNHLGHERVVTEVRKFSDGPPDWADACCVGIAQNLVRSIQIS